MGAGKFDTICTAVCDRCDRLCRLEPTLTGQSVHILLNLMQCSYYPLVHRKPIHYSPFILCIPIY